MRLLIIQPVVGLGPAGSPYRWEVAQLGAELRRRAHAVDLLVLRSCDEAALEQAVARVRPEAALVYVESLAADLAFRVAAGLRAQHSAALILFGPHAARCPDECLSRTGVEAVATAPADASVPAYLEAPAAGLERLKAPGLWINCESGVMRNAPPAPPESLADQPPPARDLYRMEPILDPAGFIEICVARGGEGSEARPPPEAAPPAPMPALARPWPVLHRPVDRVLEEMVQAAEEHLDLVGFRVGNARWAASAEWLADFAPRVARQVNLPLRTTLDPRDVTDAAAALLAQAGCEEARLRVGSGSALIRHDILGIDASTEDFQAALAALARAGVRTAAHVEVGAPYETALTLDETLQVLRRLNPHRVEAVLHYPEPGTAAHDAARENGLLVPDPAGAYLAGRPALALPGLSEEEVVTACEALPYAVHRPRTAALIRLARRVRIGKGRTLHELVVKPFLGPPVRKGPKP